MRTNPWTLVGLAAPAKLVGAGCGDDETSPTATTIATGTATAQTTATDQPSTSIPTGGPYGSVLAAPDVVAQFPPEAQELVKPLPDNVARLLLEVRNEGPKEM